ncbi:MAG TPA: FAD-dependent oxidoreductase [Dokdonella sp.]|nr:FAD-dependent oxidoreductase [Dokdonella sp.]
MHHEIVIMGGGAGGLELAARLGRRLGSRYGPEKILLIDRALTHIWKPTLHEVAAGTLDAHQEGLSYVILARRNHFSFSFGDIVDVDANGRSVSLAGIVDDAGATIVPPRRVSFTCAVLATGSGSNFFGTPGAAHARVLEKASDAERFQRELLEAFTRSAFSTRRQLAIAIVGGGATGVELAAELLEAHQLVQQALAPAQHFRLDITVVEAGPRILAGLPERISARAQAALEARGVQVRVDSPVSALLADRLIVGDTEIRADIMVWAAGIKAADVNAGFGLETNRANQFIVNAQLETSVANIFALGDCAACAWGDRQVPARAQAAHQQAGYLADLLLARLRGRPFARTFTYRDFGSLVSLGEKNGLGSLMGVLGGRNFFVEGLLAKGMYMALHLGHHRAILGTANTLVLALARLLKRRVSGRLKLH